MSLKLLWRTNRPPEDKKCWTEGVQRGGPLEGLAVNLQTATRSEIGTGQEARNLTAQLHLLSSFPPFLPAVSFSPSLLPKPLFYFSPTTLISQYLKQRFNTDRGREDINAAAGGPTPGQAARRLHLKQPYTRRENRSSQVQGSLPCLERRIRFSLLSSSQIHMSRSHCAAACLI